MASLAKEITSPARLHAHRVDPCASFNRLHSLLYSLAVLALLYHRALSLLASPSALVSSLLAAELVLAFLWATAQALRWRLLRRREFPDCLPRSEDWPALDVFVCTADPSKEPPMSVVNTALSAMAFEYPAEKLSVYVSDDGGSELTLFAFMEAAKFARHWLPFCRENGLEVRSPEVYFRSGEGDESEEMKKMYQNMNERVENAMERGHVGDDLLSSQDECEIFERWKGFTRRNHPSTIKVLLESSKDTDIMGHSLPNLVYVSREKREAIPHHFKAGALNALIRVSGIMTDAPVILTLDCDMYLNDPKVPLRALCYLLDSEMASKLAFVQFPQRYEGINKNDIYGNEIKRLFEINACEMDGLSGPDYFGTNCFFLRQPFYGAPYSPGCVSEGDEVSKQHKSNGSIRSESILGTAHQVASCAFEQNTKWGSEIGCRYGSLVKDFYTGYHLHCQGWRSVLYDPERPAFLGDAPKSLNNVLSQVKRWCAGLFEVHFTKYNPLLYGTKRAPVLTCLCHAHYASWGFWSIPLTIYAILPQLALMCHIPLFPKVSNPWFHLYAYVSLLCCLCARPHGVPNSRSNH